MGLDVFGPGILDGTESLAELAWQILRAPCAGIDVLKLAEVLTEGSVDGVHLLDAFLRFLGLALNDHQRAGELVEHVGAALLQAVLASLEFLEAGLLAFDLLLFLLEAFKLCPDLLDFVAQFAVLVVGEIQILALIF